MKKAIAGAVLAALTLTTAAHGASATVDPGSGTGKCVWARVYVGPFGGYQWYCFPR